MPVSEEFGALQSLWARAAPQIQKAVLTAHLGQQCPPRCTCFLNLKQLVQFHLDPVLTGPRVWKNPFDGCPCPEGQTVPSVPIIIGGAVCFEAPRM